MERSSSSSASSTTSAKSSFSNRQIDIQDDYNEIKDLGPDMYALLTCAKCSKFMAGEIYMCFDGHNICHECYSSQTTGECPSCFAVISPVLRNYELEQVAKKLLIKCPHRGCRLVSFHKKIGYHSLVCDFEVFMCPMQKYNHTYKCLWSGTHRDLLDHFEARHPTFMKVFANGLIHIKNFDMNVHRKQMEFFVYDNNLYLYHMSTNPAKKRISWTIQTIGPDSLAMGRIYELFIVHANKSKTKRARLSDNCIPYSMDAEKEIEEGRCVALPLECIPGYLTNTGNLYFKFLIKLGDGLD